MCKNSQHILLFIASYGTVPFITVIHSARVFFSRVDLVGQGKTRSSTGKDRHTRRVHYVLGAPFHLITSTHTVSIRRCAECVCACVCVCDGGEQDLHSPFIGKWVTENKHLLSYIELCFDWTMIIFFYSDISLYLLSVICRFL